MPVVTGRSRALTIPEVTVLSSPSGEPTATTVSPTFIRRDEPSAIGRSAGTVDLEHRDVVGRAGADQLGVVAATLVVDDADLPALGGDLGDVVVGHDVTLAVDHEARPGACLGVLALAAADPDLHGARQRASGDRGHGALGDRGLLDVVTQRGQRERVTRAGGAQHHRAADDPPEEPDDQRDADDHQPGPHRDPASRGRRRPERRAAPATVGGTEAGAPGCRWRSPAHCHRCPGTPPPLRVRRGPEGRRAGRDRARGHGATAWPAASGGPGGPGSERRRAWRRPAPRSRRSSGRGRRRPARPLGR